MSNLKPEWHKVYEYLQNVFREKGVLTNVDYLSAREDLCVSVFTLKKARWAIETMNEIDQAKDLNDIKPILLKITKEVANIT